MITLVDNYSFEEPVLLEDVDLPHEAFVYVIMKETKTYWPVYVGESGKLDQRLENHEKYPCWRKHCSGRIYVALLKTPSSEYSPQDRREIEKEIRDRYNPACNEE